VPSARGGLAVLGHATCLAPVGFRESGQVVAREKSWREGGIHRGLTTWLSRILRSSNGSEK
jgi:hypothetical protein